MKLLEVEKFFFRNSNETKGFWAYVSMEADLLQEDEMLHIFYNYILKLEVQRKLATVRAIPPS